MQRISPESNPNKSLFHADGSRVYSLVGIVSECLATPKKSSLKEKFVSYVGKHLRLEPRMPKYDLNVVLKELCEAPIWPRGQVSELVNLRQVFIPDANYYLFKGQAVLIYGDKPKFNSELVIAKGVQALDSQGLAVMEAVHDPNVMFQKETRPSQPEYKM
ncbi:hypothetical protein JW711_06200 [Candidatus Woesearchaeota archaeon]|nr:hypothetical protein [Candidatus Woesearchaeota archaeon]